MCRWLGYKMLNAIDHVTVITPHAVVAAAILNGSRQLFSREDLMADIETYMNYLFSLDVRLADTLLIDYNHAVSYVFDQYVSRKFIEVMPRNKDRQSEEQLFSINYVKTACSGLLQE
jgi:glycerol-3-phosphate O-acyltransferase